MRCIERAELRALALAEPIAHDVVQAPERPPVAGVGLSSVGDPVGEHLGLADGQGDRRDVRAFLGVRSAAWQRATELGLLDAAALTTVLGIGEERS